MRHTAERTRTALARVGSARSTVSASASCSRGERASAGSGAGCGRRRRRERARTPAPQKTSSTATIAQTMPAAHKAPGAISWTAATARLAALCERRRRRARNLQRQPIGEVLLGASVARVDRLQGRRRNGDRPGTVGDDGDRLAILRSRRTARRSGARHRATRVARGSEARDCRSAHALAHVQRNDQVERHVERGPRRIGPPA